MTGVVLTTFDWVPEFPRGYVRDLRVRWALEEAGLEYEVATMPFRDRGPDHFGVQPFGQVPWLKDGDVTLFESGAILMHLGERSERLLPAGGQARADALEWTFAALNSVEMASLPWSILKFSGGVDHGGVWENFDAFLGSRLQHLEQVVSGREWLAGQFSIADILMVDVLRLVDRFERLSPFPGCRTYVGRGTARPSFVKAHADQLSHFAAADE